MSSFDDISDTPGERADFWLGLHATEGAEHLTGQAYYEVPGLTFHLHRRISDQRRMHLSETCDTYFGMKWSSFMRDVLPLTDFEVIYKTEDDDERIIAVDGLHKLVLLGRSTKREDAGERTTDKINVIGAITLPKEAHSKTDAYRALTKAQTSITPYGKDEFLFDLDGREGLRLRLNRIFASDPSPDFVKLPSVPDSLDMQSRRLGPGWLISSEFEHFGLQLEDLPTEVRQIIDSEEPLTA